jgi:tRNA pseudouridine38-40 synthase
VQIKLTLEYEGTAYQGWQVQPNGPTVQAAVEDAVARLLGDRVRVTAAGRTDTGVHAAGQVVCFRAEKPLDPPVVARALNALTPPDIVVRRAEAVGDSFDPRRSATSRTYVYRVWNAPTPNVFWRRFAWHVRQRLDVAAMDAAAQDLLGEHDFSAFRAAGCDAAHPVRRVVRSEVRATAPLIEYTVEANAFLRHMVRNIVGTLVEVGTGARTRSACASLLAAGDRTLAGPTAPAHGLCLVAVTYPDE